jgi:hypothetical protein
MIFGTQGLSFHQGFVCQLLFISAEDVSVSRRTGLLGLFFVLEGPSFRQRFLSQQ